MNLKEKQIKPFTAEWIVEKNKSLLKIVLKSIAAGIIAVILLMTNGQSLYSNALASIDIMTQKESTQLLDEFESHYFGQFVFDYKDYAKMRAHFLKAKSMTYYAFYEFIDSIAVMANDYASSFIFNTSEVKYFDNYMAKRKDVTPLIEVKEMAGKKVGYIQLKAINSEVNSEISQVLTEYERQGVHSLILDMTASPLGTTEETVRFLDLFISNDEIMRYQTNDGYYHVYLAQAGAFKFEHLYVLINDEVSGAGEIVAVSLKNHLKKEVDLIGKLPYGTPYLFDYHVNDKHGYIFKYAIGKWQVGDSEPSEAQFEMSQLQSVYAQERALEWIEKDLN